ncbi:FtsQ-type POTRA domain-containing protein [Lusitaniella coriacea LEGE 07157]|uniref:FtsQ-type POTRA domain-containing protein n=1 Tax=Lusitaniella coriacea LEGE 07157 TaxID=945747 RepID=A0A8J7B6E0_9CYAN|nr:FtsQ-type POTRA domain-containing protein [Lusitaniella coriacea]MBE9114274.1 FtsQ-type POTRA domain-containing protein [Lusitaniella coriacea LEGE 07157]
MTSIASVSPAELQNRRQRLKRRRKIKVLQGLWRSLLVSSIAGGLFWAISQPYWIVQNPDQIEIEGNQLLSAQSIRTLLALSYPKPLWQLQPDRLSQRIKASAPIAEARVTRQLLPPGLTVEVKERHPVAIVLPSTRSKNNSISPETPAFVDEQGFLMPQSSYTKLAPSQLPKLEVMGLNADIAPYWSEIYQTTRQTALKIFTIDFQNPSNLILKTELGEAHFGHYTPRFPEQLETLAQMRTLPNQIESSEIDYIDLTNPDSPSIQLRKVAARLSQ